MRGRKPIPNELHALRGNPSRLRLDGRGVKAKPDLPTCPKHLDREAKAEWRRIAKELHVLGLLAQVDRAALAAYCTAWSRWVEAEGKVQQFGTVMKAKDSNNLFTSPYLWVANKAMEQMKSFLTEFGMTPAARTRVQAVKQDDEADEFARFLGGAPTPN
jgi:P27 family predicted phage terminase small subunit